MSQLLQIEPNVRHPILGADGHAIGYMVRDSAWNVWMEDLHGAPLAKSRPRCTDVISTLYGSNEALTGLCAAQNRIIQRQNETLAQLGAQAAEEEQACCAKQLFELVGKEC